LIEAIIRESDLVLSKSERPRSSRNARWYRAGDMVEAHIEEGAVVVVGGKIIAGPGSQKELVIDRPKKPARTIELTPGMPSI